jgi:hypothetical protein
MKQIPEHYTHTYGRAIESVHECCAKAKRRIQVEANAFMAAANVLGIQRTFTRAGQCLLYMGESDEGAIIRKVVFSVELHTAQEGDVVVIAMKYNRKGKANHRSCYHIMVVTPHEWANRDALSELKEWR